MVSKPTPFLNYALIKLTSSVPGIIAVGLRHICSLDYAIIKLTSSVPCIISILHAAAQWRERLYTLFGLRDTHSKPISQERTYYAIGNELNIDYYEEVSRINIAPMTSRYIYNPLHV